MYQLIRAKRKTIAIYVKEDQSVIVKAPHHVPKKVIEDFVESKRTWIETQQEARAVEEKEDWWEKKEIYFLGAPKKIKIVPTKNNKNRVDLLEEEIIIYSNDNEEAAKAFLLAELKQQFLNFITPFVDNYCLLLGCKYNKITIRKQKTRWGSCSSKGNLSYNLQLIGAPFETIQYVLLHEVMHLKHFDHSEAFWAGIAKVMPAYKKHQVYLKEHSKRLKL